jgi:nitrate reductase cytochrome c-type subunit
VGRDIGFASDTNPCLVCHDHHLAQQNFPVTDAALGGVKTAVRRPIDYPDPGSPTNLWGDESGGNEVMIDYTNKYQAPYYVGGANYEPANDSTADGSNLPNVKNFCTNNCHGVNGVYSTEHSRNLVKIDWSSGGNTRHGKYHSDDGGMGYTIAPYEDADENYNYVLSCTDCHETHGSENEWLLRTTVNGKDNISVTFAGDWWEFCTACHVLTNPYANGMYHRQRPETYFPGCPECHFHGGTLPHGL